MTKSTGVVFVNTGVKSKLSHLKGIERKNTLEEFKVEEFMKKLGKDYDDKPEEAKKEALKKFNDMSDQLLELEYKEQIDDKIWPDAEESGKQAKELLESYLGFEDVTIYKNLTKSEIDEVLLALKQQAE